MSNYFGHLFKLFYWCPGGRLHGKDCTADDDLHTRSRSNIMFKCADDTNLLVPAYSDVSLLSELEHVKQWAADNKLRKLHWLPIRERVKFKVARLVRQSLSGQAPLYLADDCRLVSDSTRRSLRSADVSTCVVPRTLSSYGDRTFAAGGPRLWNSLPVQLRNPDITYGLFRRQLKGHFCREA